ncbi:hypothetical protein ACPCBF_24830 [Streptomyces pseudogriseolus]|uniref:hypothetical protein n=1 Tax=Streptomyces pseudogriseolus TaxID=36817 RepID=UPI003FA1D64D
MTDQHTPVQFYWGADTDYCPHTEPDVDTDGEAWDAWRDRHPSSDDGPICLDAPYGEGCPTCSAEEGDMVPWSRCKTRSHTRAAATVAPQHRPVTVEVADLECLEGECEEYFNDYGDEIPGKTSCSHCERMEICEACSQPPAGDADPFPPVVAWADCQRRGAPVAAS